MLYLLPSKFVALVSPETACLETAYGVVCGRGTCAAIDPLLIILPRDGMSLLCLTLYPSLASLWLLRLENLERLLRAQEGCDNVDVHDLHEI